MPERKNVDWAAVQRDRDAGIPVSELVKKYKISNPAIYTKTHGPNGNGHAGGAKRARAAKRGAFKVADNGTGNMNGYGEMLRDLEAKRAKMDTAIAAIRELAG